MAKATKNTVHTMLMGFDPSRLNECKIDELETSWYYMDISDLQSAIFNL